jgi:hypothetical protein
MINSETESIHWVRWGETWPILFFLLFGIANTVVTKGAYYITSEGSPQYGKHRFQKPWFLTSILFFAMFCALPIYAVYTCIQHRKGLTRWIGVHELSFKSFCEFAIPATADAFEQIVSAICILLVGASYDSMMKSGTLISVSLISRFVFKKHYYTYQWLAIGIVLLSLTLVGLAGILASGHSDTIRTNRLWTAVILVLKLISQLGYALRLSYEEYFVQKCLYHPVMITGIEGFWGFLVIGVIGEAVAHHLGGEEGNGLREDFWDTMHQIGHSSGICVVIAVLWFLGLTYNCVSTTLIGKTSAVVRTLMEALRTFLIWMIQFAIFYGCQQSKSLYEWRLIGEQWTQASLIQAVGFALMIWGLFMYNALPRYPCWQYEPPEKMGKLSSVPLLPQSDQESPPESANDIESKQWS